MENPKNILYLVTSGHFGGAQKYVADLSIYLHKQENWSVTVAVGENNDPSWLAELANLSINVIKLKHLKRNISPWHDTSSINELFNLYQKIKPDIIHLNSSKIGFTGSLAAAIYRKYTKRAVKVVYTVHGLVLNEKLSLIREIFYFFAEWLGAKFKQKIICVSAYDKQSVRRWHLAPYYKLNIIHNGIATKDLNFFSAEESQTKLLIKYPKLTDKKIVGTIANLYDNKNISALINSAELLNNKRQDLAFLVIGEGPERSRLEKLITDKDLNDQFILAGSLHDAHRYLKAFNIFVLPSRKEGLPYTLLEAMATGLPIVATNVGGIPETLFTYYPKNQFQLEETDNFVGLAHAIEKYINQPKLTTDELENIKEKIDIKNMIEQTIAIYDI